MGLQRTILYEATSGDPPGALGLRTELSLRNATYAAVHGYLHERTDGAIPSIVYGRDETGRHGNFHPASYAGICASPAWSRRLGKVHTAYRRVRVRANWCWKELDCSNSSDALLMNIFCYPGFATAPATRALLGTSCREIPVFGFRPRTPLSNGRYDQTEVDMQLADLLVEAKLTESDFQVAEQRLVHRYRDLEEVFDRSELPVRRGKYVAYQLIRGTLAAYASNVSFCVLCDERRPDLTESWYGILRAVRIAELRCRLKLLTWQELAGAAAPDLRHFLATKYGIEGR